MTREIEVKDLAHVLRALIQLRNREMDLTTVDQRSINAFEDAIDAINRHPLLRAARTAALDELAEHSQEHERGE